MSEQADGETVDLGDPRPLSTRQQWRRSAVHLADGRAYVGTADGRVLAVDAEAGDERWTVDVGDSAVALTRAGDVLVVGTRGPDAHLRALDPADGSERWALRTADDVGDPTQESLFYQPYVVSLAVDDRVYAGARRYERRPEGEGPDRHFESRVYALDPADGEVAWTHDAPASLIAVDARDGLVAAAYNRCPGDDPGVVAFGADGEVRWTWRPPEGDQRLAGDVSLGPGGVAVASHGDYRGYLLDRSGVERWRVDLGRTREAGDERIYAYPNHVAAVEGAVVFATGNTFPEEGRETVHAHPNEHTLTCVDSGGDGRWTRPVEGWVGELSGEDRLVVPVGQHFRTRDPDSHALWTADSGGAERQYGAEGVLTAAAVGGGRLAAVEEPIEYHDEDRQRGAYRLHLFD